MGCPRLLVIVDENSLCKEEKKNYTHTPLQPFLNRLLKTQFQVNQIRSFPQLSDKDLAYLEERIKRSSKNRPSTAPSESTAKSNVSARGGSDSSANAAKKKEDKRPGKPQLARWVYCAGLTELTRLMWYGATQIGILSCVASPLQVTSAQALLQVSQRVRRSHSYPQVGEIIMGVKHFGQKH